MVVYLIYLYNGFIYIPQIFYSSILERNMRHTKRLLALITIVMLAGMQACQSPAPDTTGYDLPEPKNIILLVSDGMGYNHVLATNYYEHGEAEAQVYEQPGWLRLGLATYSAALIDGVDTTYLNGYAPRTAWEDAGYLPTDYTDSGAAATALSTGEKVFSGSIGIGMEGDTLTHISQAAKALDKSVGILASVPLSHATPAGFLAHNHERSNYEEIGKHMLFHSRADVIMGAGHPGYNNDGEQEEMSSRYIGSDELWEQIRANDGRTEFENNGDILYLQDADGDGNRDPWTFIDEREDFIALADGPAPKRLLGIPQVHNTLNQGRTMGEDERMPFEQPLNENVPTLEEMTRASLNVLEQNEKGFFVMIEGGAVDWASHDNHLGRMIEEQMDFNNSVDAAVEWVEENSSWDETLIIVTSDHECGYLTGPNHPDPVNDKVVNRGQGNLPEVAWHFDSHTNQLVPFYAKGPGVELFSMFAEEKDPVRGPFLQNTEVAQAIFMMWGKPDIAVHRLTD